MASFVTCCNCSGQNIFWFGLNGLVCFILYGIIGPLPELVNSAGLLFRRYNALSTYRTFCVMMKKIYLVEKGVFSWKIRL